MSDSIKRIKIKIKCIKIDKKTNYIVEIRGKAKSFFRKNIIIKGSAPSQKEQYYFEYENIEPNIFFDSSTIPPSLSSTPKGLPDPLHNYPECSE